MTTEADDTDAEVQVTDLSVAADGTVHVGLEMQAGETEIKAPDEEPVAGDPGPDVVGAVVGGVVGGAAKVAKAVLGAAWDVIKPEQ